MKARNFVLAFVACFGAAAIGSGVTGPALKRPWYRDLKKPSWQPPGGLFGPVWSTLYSLMSVSAGLLWSSQPRQPAATRAKWLFGLQLVLNALWSVVFFGRRSPGAGLAVIVPLELAIIGYVACARRVSRAASWLFVPYAGWVAFASVLNGWIWHQNRAQR